MNSVVKKTLTTQPWPRVRNLPQKERIPFSMWLNGQTRPWIEGVPDEDQDAYYPKTYERN